MDIHRNRNQNSGGEIKIREEKSKFGRMMNKTKKTKD